MENLGTYITTLGLVLLAFGYSGCTKVEASNSQPERYEAYIYVDSGTGCQYVSTNSGTGRGGITPRMDSSGHQICNKQ